MYQLRVLVNGRPIPVYHDYRTGLDWIEARNGTKYEVEVKNDSYNRILSVVSIDGLNVINGKHEDPLYVTGYIIHQHSNVKIPGWKISADNVREFYFTPQEQSYSAKLGADLSNTGVIATAIYKEKIQWTYTTSTYCPPPYTIKEPWGNPWDRKINFNNQNTFDSGNSSGVMRGMSASVNAKIPDPESVYNMNFVEFSAEIPTVPKLATGSGEVKDFKTHKASFGERVLETVISLYYDTKENLIKKGIYNQQDNLPKPFPSTEFCPDI